MLFTDPEEDLDVSNYIHRNGIIESGITEVCVCPGHGMRGP